MCGLVGHHGTERVADQHCGIRSEVSGDPGLHLLAQDVVGQVQADLTQGRAQHGSGEGRAQSCQGTDADEAVEHRPQTGTDPLLVCLIYESGERSFGFPAIVRVGASLGGVLCDFDLERVEDP
ncbi:hypothetical protein CIT14_21765, partial [Virgibacillus profundi]